MTALVAPARIERIVGARRHEHLHLARAVSAEQVVYILHPYDCVANNFDLRFCRWSQALDEGIDMRRWRTRQDRAVIVTVAYGQLRPAPILAGYGIDLIAPEVTP